MPNRFVPLGNTTDLQTILPALNNNFAQLDNENITKAYKGPNGNSIVEGRYTAGRYGNVFYDNDGVARILIGMAPDDGRMGIWVSKPGQDVLTLLGG